MRIAATKPLFAWDCLEDSPTLKTIRQFLKSVPDAKLLASLRRWRGKGRDDYPVSVLWGTMLLTILLRHQSVESCLGELRRNAALRLLIGIRSESQVPRKWNMSRFMKVLGTEPHLTLLHEAFDTMVRQLAEVVKDLGVHTAGDASGLSGRLPRSKNPLDNPSLPQPTGGRKEYTDEEGNVTKVVEWFGYKFHLLVDTSHEVALAYQITSANTGDNKVLPDILAEAQENLPDEKPKRKGDAQRGRIRTLAYDKAADDEKVHELLHEAKIAPVIENRSMWKENFERMLPGHDGNSNIVYDEAGTVYCYDKVSDPPVRHRMAYIGHEPSRGTLKYRCGACHGGWKCPSHKRCNSGRKYGKTVRVKREIDLRRFPPIPRATKQFERRYKGRTAVERVNARIKIFWGADDGNITGAERFHGYLGVVMVVHIGLAALLAACPRREGTLGRMRLSPIARALHEKLRL
ncbi:MAG: transposase [Phycisphaerae bacterium]|nr:transposase [Phycisphaerae bacterium]